MDESKNSKKSEEVTSSQNIEIDVNLEKQSGQEYWKIVIDIKSNDFSKTITTRYSELEKYHQHLLKLYPESIIGEFPPTDISFSEKYSTISSLSPYYFGVSQSAIDSRTEMFKKYFIKIYENDHLRNISKFITIKETNNIQYTRTDKEDLFNEENCKISRDYIDQNISNVTTLIEPLKYIKENWIQNYLTTINNIKNNKEDSNLKEFHNDLKNYIQLNKVKFENLKLISNENTSYTSDIEKEKEQFNINKQKDNQRQIENEQIKSEIFKSIDVRF